MKEEVLQIGEQGADIEMHVQKNQAGIYFVSFFMFKINEQGERVLAKNESPVQLFNSKEEIHEKLGSLMAGKLVTI